MKNVNYNYGVGGAPDWVGFDLISSMSLYILVRVYILKTTKLH